MKIAVIGPGVMGTGITQLFAGYNYNVVLIGQDKKNVGKALDKIKLRLKKLEDQGKLIDKRSILKRIDISTDINDVKGASLVIEAVPENLNLKKRLFKQLDETADRKTILATNTSALSVTEIASEAENQDRIIGLHFFNPPTKMQLVEVIRGKKTSPSIIRRCLNLIDSIGKVAIQTKDTPGFIVNRLLVPLINDAARLVDKKVATVEDIDRAMKLGASHPLGPFQLADLVGIDIVVDIIKILAKNNKELKPSMTLVRKVKRKELGKKTGKGFYEYK